MVVIPAIVDPGQERAYGSRNDNDSGYRPLFACRTQNVQEYGENNDNRD